MLIFLFVSLVGANLNNGTNTGTFYWNLNNTSTNSNANIGGRILESCVGIQSLPLGKINNKTPLCVGSENENSGVKQVI